MRYLLAAMVMLAMLGGPAYSQVSMGNTNDTNEANKDPLQLQYEREKRERDQNEKSYNETMKRLKGQAPVSAKSDPWKIVRPNTPTTDSSKR
jgi:hypothetical protein